MNCSPIFPQTAEISPLWPSELEPAWQQAPSERTPAFHPVFYRIARVLQTVVRDYTASVWNPVDHAHDFPFATGVLAWISSEPARRNTVSEFTYEVLSAPLMASFFWSVGRRLPALLDPLAAELQARGETELARTYLPRRIARIVDALKRNRRVINRLIGSDEALMLDLQRWASAMRTKPRTRPAASLRLRQAWTRTLKRALPGYDLSPVVPALFTAVTAELEQALADFRTEESLRAEDQNRFDAAAHMQCCPDAMPAPSDVQSEHPRSEDGECACTPGNC